MAMATELKFDELNRLGERKPKPIPYREFFGKMRISPAQMRERIELAEDIEDAMLFVFAYWLIREDLGYTDSDMRQMTKEKLTEVFDKYGKSDAYITKHIEDVSNEIIDATARHTRVDNAVDEPTESTETGYWTSLDRAMIIAENEANSFTNYTEYRSAKAKGYTKKRWLTELDDRVRLTHTLVESKTVDIDGLFLVGDSLMRFPRDNEYDPDPSEVVNCRCACVYEP